MDKVREEFEKWAALQSASLQRDGEGYCNTFVDESWEAWQACAKVMREKRELTIESYVAQVPEHCDRITWRNRYYHLDSLQPAPAVPDGWHLVPYEPTDKMIIAGINTPVADSGNDDTDQPEDYRNVYKAMLSAAPNYKGE